MTDAPPPRFRPAAPVPHTRNLSALGVLRELGRNTVAAFGARAYREPYVYSRSWVQHFLLINDPEGIKRVLLDNVGNYNKSVQLQRTTRPALGNGLLNAEGDAWRTQRRAAAPMFSARHVTGFAPQMAHAAEDALARWDELGDGAVIDVADEMMRLAYDIISRTMFSNHVTMQYGAMAAAVMTYLETIGRVDVLTVLGLPQWVPTPKRLRGRAPLRFFRTELDKLIAGRRAQFADDPDAMPNDLLTLLLTARDPEGGALFGDAEVFDNVMTFLFAGHETTANVMAWTLYLLSQCPEADARVAEEARGGGDPAYTRMVLEESMRLYPPAPIISRDSVGPDRVCGIDIEANTAVMISPWVLHRHKALWDDPDYFDPERFAPGRREAIQRFAYIPFGGGPRICIGMGFAMQEAMTILGTIMRRYRFALVDGHPVEPLAHITLRPAHGIRMVLRRR